MIPPEPPHLAGRTFGKGAQVFLRLAAVREGAPARTGMRFAFCGKGWTAGRGTFLLAACGLPPQCERVLTDPLTQADCFPPARKTVIKEGIKKIRVYTRQYSYNALIFLPYTPFFSGRLCDTKAFSLWTRCTGCGACTTRALLTAEVNSACAALAARPPEGWPGAPERWYTVILTQTKGKTMR